MNTPRTDFDKLLHELMIYRINKSQYSFEALVKICEMHGWTMDEFNAAFEERQAFLKLQGKI